MTPLWGHTDTVAPFIASLIPGCERGFGACEAMGVIDRDGRLVGGFVFNNWEPERGIIEISGASVSRRFMNRTVIRELFGYPFDRLGCQAIVTRTHPDSRHLRRMWATVGGVEYEVPRLRGRDTSEIIIVVTEEAWRASKFAENSNVPSRNARSSGDAESRSRPTVHAAGAGA